VPRAAQMMKKWCSEGEGYKKGARWRPGALYSWRGGAEEKGEQRGVLAGGCHTVEKEERPSPIGERR
jgi:hypothetical protein